MKNYLDHLGSWPAEIHDSVKNKEIRVISQSEAINFIHGSENQNKVSFYVSNDLVHVGVMTITSGKFTDVENHEGDEVLWVLEGSIQIRAWKEEEEGSPIFKPCHSLKTNDRFLIPEGYHHQYYNLCDGNAKILFAVGPNL